MMNNNRAPQSPATIQGLEKGMSRFVESASLKIAQLEKQMSELKAGPPLESKKLVELEYSYSSLQTEVEALRISLKDMKLKDLNKYILYKDQEAERIQSIEKSLGQLELKVGTIQNIVKRLQNNLSHIQENITEGNNKAYRLISEQKSYVDNQVRYLIQKQIEYVKGINPDLNEIRKAMEFNVNQVATSKSVLKQCMKNIQMLESRITLTDNLPAEFQEVRRHVTTKLKQFETETIEASLASVNEQLVQPFKELHRRELDTLSQKIGTIVESTSSVKDQIIGLVSSSQSIADKRYDETSKAIFQICRILKTANPVF